MHCWWVVSKIPKDWVKPFLETFIGKIAGAISFGTNYNIYFYWLTRNACVYANTSTPIELITWWSFYDLFPYSASTTCYPSDCSVYSKASDVYFCESDNLYREVFGLTQGDFIFKAFSSMGLYTYDGTQSALSQNYSAALQETWIPPSLNMN